MKGKSRKTSVLVVTILLLLAFSFFFVDIGSEHGSAAGPPPPGAPMYVPHDVIRIEGDAQLEINATAEGWPGDGSASDPYIIEGYDIDGQGGSNCIFISNISSHIVIRDCKLSNSTKVIDMLKLAAGITLFNVTESVVERIVMTDTGHAGLIIINCNEMMIRDNDLENRSWSIALISTHETVVVDNRIRNVSGGALAMESYGTVDYGGGCSNNTFEGNEVVNATYGFIAWMGPQSGDNLVANNSWAECDYPLYIARFNNSRVENNSISGGIHGIFGANVAGDVLLSGNEFAFNKIESMSGDGIRLTKANGNFLHDNLIAESGDYGISLTNCAGNLIYRNILSNNNGTGMAYDPLRMQASDDSNDNFWFSTSGVGNFWSDWTTPDVNHDGIVDNPYPVGGGLTFDYYPLTAFVSPPGDLTYTTGQAWVNLDWSAPDLSLGSDVIEYRITRTSGVEVTTITIDGTETSYNDTTVVSWREYSYTVTAITTVGESAESDEVVVLVPDESPPTLTIDSPADDSYLNSEDVLVSWIGTDDESGIQNYSVSVDGAAPVDVEANTSYSAASLADGEHQVTVWATDNAGNVESASVTFVVDTQAPEVESTTPSVEEVLVDTVIAATFSEAMDEDSVTFTVSDGVTGLITWVGNTATFTPDEDLEYDTEYLVIVEGEDLAGNELSSYGFSFTTTDTGLVEGVVVDENGDVMVGANVSLSTGEFAITGSDGEFSIRAHPGANKVTIKKAGYEDRVVDVTIATGQTEDLGPVTMKKPSDLGLIVVAIVAVAAIGAVAFFVMRRRR